MADCKTRSHTTRASPLPADVARVSHCDTAVLVVCAAILRGQSALAASPMLMYMLTASAVVAVYVQ